MLEKHLYVGALTLHEIEPQEQDIHSLCKTSLYGVCCLIWQLSNDLTDHCNFTSCGGAIQKHDILKEKLIFEK